MKPNSQLNTILIDEIGEKSIKNEIKNKSIRLTCDPSRETRTTQ